MKQLKIALLGYGKMGKEVCQAVENDSSMTLAAKIDIQGDGYRTIEEAQRYCEIDVLVDFTQPQSIYENAKYCLRNGVNMVIGTTGLKDEEIAFLKKIATDMKVGCFIAPNFSTGAVLMMKFAQMAAKYFDNAEIIEYHHNQKKDAPSGTSIKTAQLMAEAKETFKSGNCEETETIQGARGGTSYSGIQIHSVRMPGFMASQEVLFGSQGQTLSIRHDSTDRKCYMDGVLLAIKYVREHKEFVYGLDNIL